jgi:hypothetical protein
MRLSSTELHPRRLVIAAKVVDKGIGKSPIPTLIPTTNPIATSDASSIMLKAPQCLKDWPETLT